jgi:sugar lactone lactonase YvrE
MMRFGVFSSALAFLVLFELNGLAQPSTIRTYAGPSGTGPVDGGQAVAQSITGPMSVISDGAGGFYFASFNQSRIYKVDAGGTLTIIAGTGTEGFSGDGGPAQAAQLVRPSAIALDGVGNLYIADRFNHRIRKITAAGVISTVAGTGTRGSDGDGEPASAAQLDSPWGIALDVAGNLFIADTGNNRIRKVSADGIIGTVAGTGEHGYSGDGGEATFAGLASPAGVVVDAIGNLIIADTGNNCIREVSRDGLINRVAGTCGAFNWENTGFNGDGGPATSAQLNFPRSVAVDASGNLFIADTFNQRIRKVSANGIISTVAGTGGMTPCGEQNVVGDGGPATAAQLSGPSGVTVDGVGNLFIADSYNNRVRMVTAAGIIHTVAGDGGIQGYRGDGGAANAALFNYPTGVAVDRTGNLFIADTLNCRVRMVTAAGIISTVARLNLPRSVAVDAIGNLFVADQSTNRVYKVSPEGAITAFAGRGAFGQGSFNGDGGPAIAAELNYPFGVAVDGAGNVFIADRANHRVRKVSPNGVIVTVAGSGPAGGGGGFSGDGGPATAAQLNYPMAVTVDAHGNLFIADTINYRIRRVTPEGIISTVAGTGIQGLSGDGGPAISAEIGSPWGVAVDGNGNLFFSAGGSAYHRIRRVTPDGIITTAVGNGLPGTGGDGGPADSAQLDTPWGVAVDEEGSLFIADSNNHRIPKVTTEP